MAVKTFTPFPDGFRLINGTALNALFTAAQQMKSINVSGGATIAGGMTVSGALKEPATVVTALGASRASAPNVPAGAINVWAAGSTSAEGIRLYALASGQGVTVWPQPTIGVKIYTAAGQVINALASATALALASAKGAAFYSADGVHIRAMKGS